jgi:hypothetical protein
MELCGLWTDVVSDVFFSVLGAFVDSMCSLDLVDSALRGSFRRRQYFFLAFYLDMSVTWTNSALLTWILSSRRLATPIKRVLQLSLGRDIFWRFLLTLTLYLELEL